MPSLPLPESERVTAYAFIDGAYLRHELRELDADWRIDPTCLIDWLRHVFNYARGGSIGIDRTTWFDAAEKDNTELSEYLDQVGETDDVSVAEGSVMGQGSRRRQKGVDGLLAVHALTGAFRGRYEVAIIVAGDGDFVPLVHAIREAGPMVFVAGFAASSAKQLRLAGDRFMALPTPELDDNGVWAPMRVARRG